MMTQADILPRDQSYGGLATSDQDAPATSSGQPQKPTTFGMNFPSLDILNLNANEHSPIKPSKYLADDR